MESILVAGGAGYIGSHVAKQLSLAGFRPIVLDNLSTGNRWAVQWGPFVRGDISDAALVRDIVDRFRVDAVIHLAASAYIGESVSNPRKYYRNNVAGSLAFLDALIDCGVGKIVFSSTCAVYGNVADALIDESHARQPVNPYGESKLFIEAALRWLDSAHRLKSVCLRYFNAAGADPEGDLGEVHDPETHIIPLAIEAALDPRKSLSVFGVDYPTEDGSAVRDYTHVHDLARAHILALHYLCCGNESASVNLGTGKGNSVLDVIRAIEGLSGRRMRVESFPRRAGDPSRLVANPGAAARVIGWQPIYTDLHQTIEDAWRWRTQGELRAGIRALAVQQA